MIKKLLLLFLLPSFLFAKGKVSVIIPIYNSEKWIEQCLDSVINQTYKNLEIILIDDKSTDDTYNILKQYEARDKRIRLYQNEVNSKTAFTRNRGIDLATGDYLYFIDADDWIDLVYIEKLVAGMETHDGVEMVIDTDIINVMEMKNVKSFSIGAYEVMFEANKIYSRKEYGLLYPNTAPIWNSLVKSSLVKKNDIRFPHQIFDDVYFKYAVLLHTDKIFVLDTDGMGYHYRLHLNSDTGRYGLKERKIEKFNEIFNMTAMANALIMKLNIENEVKQPLSFLTLYSLIKKDLRPSAYLLSREIAFEIKDVVLAHADFYDYFEMLFFENLLKYDNYNDYIEGLRKYKEQNESDFYTEKRKEYLKVYKNNDYLVAKYSEDIKGHDILEIKNTLRFENYTDYKLFNTKIKIMFYSFSLLVAGLTIYILLVVIKLLRKLIKRHA